MKELTIKEKAKACDDNYKAYTELINRLEDVKNAIKKQNYGIAMDILCKPYPDFQVTTHSELKESEGERIRNFLIKQANSVLDSITDDDEEVPAWKSALAWLEKQGNLMKALQISNARIGELIEENYYLKEQLEKQGNNMGISEATKQELEDNLNKALKKETPESCNEFLDEQGEQKPVVIPKFRVGDTIKNKKTNKIFTISDYSKLYEYYHDINHYHEIKFSEQDEWELVEQKPIIEMKSAEESLGIDSDTYNKIVDECVYGEQKPIKEHNACEFCEDRYGCVSPCSMKLIEEQKPIEEYNITGIGSKHATGKLAEKIKEFDEKTKELKLLKQDEQKPFGQRDECLNCQFNYAGECKGFCAMKRSNRKPHKPADKVKSRQEKLTEFEKAVKQVMEEAIECGDTHNLKADADMLLRLVQKSSWSEEDIELLNNTIKFIEDRVAATSPSLRTYSPTLTGKEIPFLKALKDRVQPKQGWSEEDEKILNLIIARLHSHPNVEVEEYGKDYHWLKSLKQRYTWKPSDEQMDALRYVTNFDYGGYKATLVSLYEQLKKLRGE